MLWLKLDLLWRETWLIEFTVEERPEWRRNVVYAEELLIILCWLLGAFHDYSVLMTHLTGRLRQDSSRPPLPTEGKVLVTG